MMRWQVPQNNEEIDEHDLPTEPIPYDVAPPSSSTVSNGANPSYGEAFPAPQPIEQPFPRQYVPGTPQPGQAPGAKAYPVLPPRAPVVPKGRGKRPAGSAVPTNVNQPGKKADKPAKVAPTRPSATPALVGLFFVAVQLLLLVRFALVIIHEPGSILWVQLVFGLSTLFIWPFRALVERMSLPFPVWPEIYTLLAILLYGMISRILVRFLKAILRP